MMKLVISKVFVLTEEEEELIRDSYDPWCVYNAIGRDEDYTESKIIIDEEES